jgi:histidyl-tRNA synthetase
MSPILPVKGTRDFYPEELAIRKWLYSKIRDVSEDFGYQEYDGPFLEKLELYAAKSGEELVKEQSFVFPDRGGEMIALRPELTPSLARMIAERNKSLLKPIRWWSFGPFWRYERPQKGRSREFFQWNIDLLGVESDEADAEITAVAAALFKNIGLKPEHVKILVNNRRLVDTQLTSIGVTENQRDLVFRLIDRKDKMEPADWAAYALEIGLSNTQIDGLKQMLRNQEAWKDSKELQGFFEASERLGVAEYLAYDPTVIRGLDYYTGTVYEARDLSQQFRAIFGGGRYDDLVSDVGGDPVPGTGFAMGDMVILLVLENYGLIPQPKTNPSQVLVTYFDTSTLKTSLELSSKLRAQNFRVEWYPQPDKLAKQIKYADKQGIPVVLILGPDELASEEITIKNMRTGEQSAASLRDPAMAIQTILSSFKEE